MGGDEGSRTLGLCHATAALSQLSYVPKTSDYFRRVSIHVNGKVEISPTMPRRHRRRRQPAPTGRGNQRTRQPRCRGRANPSPARNRPLPYAPTTRPSKRPSRETTRIRPSPRLSSFDFCYDGVQWRDGSPAPPNSAIMCWIMYESTVGGIYVESLLPHICLALAAFATTYVLTPVVKKIAIKLDAVDYPSKRRVNTKPIPRMGGLAVFAGLAVACALQIFGTLNWGWPSALVPHPSMEINYPLLALAFLIIVATGALDDVFQLSPKAKLAGQLIAAVVAASSGLLIHAIVNPFEAGEISLGLFAYPVTIIYLVAYTNIINLIDGLDGLATGISAIAGCSMFSFAVLAGRGDAAAISIALVGSCFAFLRYNFNPAQIFLGDSGSLLLGFALGSISLLNVSRTAALTSLIIPLIVAGVPILDTFSAIIRRMRAHVSIGQADKGHIHHRLIQGGYDQRQAVLLIYLWCILLNLGAAAINQVEVFWRIIIFLVLLALSAAFAFRLHLFEPVLRHHYNPKTKKDEIVTPDDAAFADEVRAERQQQKERAAKLKNHKAGAHGASRKNDKR